MTELMAQKEPANGTPSSITARTSEETVEDMHVGSDDRTDLEAGGTRPTYALQIPEEIDRGRFCCRGRFYFGPEPGFLVCSLILLLLPAFVFYQIALPRLPETLQLGVAWAVGVILTATVGVLCTVALSDPGIIPKDTCQTITPPSGPSRVKFVLINGVNVPQKWCTTCCIYRPPRAKHCSVCNNCVRRFDHHCPWISNCVGARNYRVFVIFVFCCAVYSLTIVTSATSALLRDIRDGGESVSFSSFWAATRRSPQLAGLFLYSLCCCVPMINLFLFNIYLILNNITTNEEVLQLFPDRNPYSAGWRENLRMFLFQPVEPSLISKRSLRHHPHQWTSQTETLSFLSDPSQSQPLSSSSSTSISPSCRLFSHCPPVGTSSLSDETPVSSNQNDPLSPPGLWPSCETTRGCSYPNSNATTGEARELALGGDRGEYVSLASRKDHE